MSGQPVVLPQRRRAHDTSPRATYAPNTTLGHTKLVLRNGAKHIRLMSMGFEEIMACETDSVLMRAPEGFAMTCADLGEGT